MSVSEIRDRHSSLTIAPGFHGACHWAGHFGPDPLVHPGYELPPWMEETSLPVEHHEFAAAPDEQRRRQAIGPGGEFGRQRAQPRYIGPVARAGDQERALCRRGGADTMM